MAVVPEKAHKAQQALGLANKCPSFEAHDTRSRSVLFHSQNCKQIFFVSSELRGYLIIGGAAWELSLKSKENSVREDPRPIDRHFAMGPFGNCRHGQHGFRIERREKGRDEGRKQSDKRK
ncbi:MAG: hypothetical protein M3Y27_16500 [Acidobacteriota bacterium]|nr:hypothetical protein [Acidobacteriota bacterium]